MAMVICLANRTQVALTASSRSHASCAAWRALRQYTGSICTRRSYSSAGSMAPSKISDEEPYTLYGLRPSYFSAKVDAALHFYPFQYKYHSKTATVMKDIERRAKTVKMPVLKTAQDNFIIDSTLIYDHLDQICSSAGMQERRMFPEGLVGVQVHVIEEYFDEWFPRHALNWRWPLPASAEYASRAMAKEVCPSFWQVPLRGAAADRIAQWGKRAMRSFGLESLRQQEAARKESLRILRALDVQLQSTPYALGARPCAVDTVLLGGLRAHFLHDPDCTETLDGCAALKTWADLSTHAPPASWGELAPFPESTPFAQLILTEMRDGPYRSYVLANAQALRHGEKAFTITVEGEEVSFRARREVEHARQYVQERVQSLRAWSPDAHQEAREWLRSCGLFEVFGDQA